MRLINRETVGLSLAMAATAAFASVASANVASEPTCMIHESRSLIVTAENLTASISTGEAGYSGRAAQITYYPDDIMTEDIVSVRTKLLPSLQEDFMLVGKDPIIPTSREYSVSLGYTEQEQDHSGLRLVVENVEDSLDTLTVDISNPSEFTSVQVAYGDGDMVVVECPYGVGSFNLNEIPNRDNIGDDVEIISMLDTEDSPSMMSN